MHVGEPWGGRMKCCSFMHTNQKASARHILSAVLGILSAFSSHFPILLTKLLPQTDLLSARSRTHCSGSKHRSTCIIDYFRHILIDKHVAVLLSVFCHSPLAQMSCGRFYSLQTTFCVSTCEVSPAMRIHRDLAHTSAMHMQQKGRASPLEETLLAGATFRCPLRWETFLSLKQ